jgi:hypothetical protein
MKYFLCGKMSFDSILCLELVSYFVNILGRDGRAEEGIEGPAAEQYNTHGQSENIAGTGTCLGRS